VGSYTEGATPEGLMDMAGNVWEWMANEYKKGKPHMSLRGGAWYSSPGDLRCTARYVYHPSYRNNPFGFRVVRSQS
jgi:formylglycine-generating enzyme required for sulfatase activity